jgi:protein TonB
MEEVAELPELINRSAVASEIGRVYPASLRDRGITGMVHLSFVVDVEGGTRDVRVLQSSSVDFTAASVLVVGKMRFRPARIGGRPVPVRVTLPIRFELATAPPPGPPPIGRQPDPSWPE